MVYSFLATAGRNHQTVPNIAKKCFVHQICKLCIPFRCNSILLNDFQLINVTRSLFLPNQGIKNLYGICMQVMWFLSIFSQSKISRLPAYLTIQMVRFFYKEKESVNAKVLKVSNELCLTEYYSSLKATSNLQ